MAADSAGTAELPPATASCASRRSSATFSACIIAVRALGERGLLARLRRRACQFLDRVAQPVGLAPGALDLARDAPRPRPARRAAPATARSTAAASASRPPKASSKRAMRRGIDQSALVVLAVDLDQRRAELLQRLHAHRLVVDEGAGAPVGKLHAAQDQLVFDRRCRARRAAPRRMVARAARTPR